MFKRIGTLAALLVVLWAGSAVAQNATTSLRGVVKDASGAVVPGAVVVLKNKGTGQTLSAKSNGSGEYQLQQIPPAKYTITIDAPGFNTQTRVAELLVGQPATINVGLVVGGTGDVVDVTASGQLNTIDASLGGSTDNATIQALPSETRNIPDLLANEPGVFFLPAPSNPALQDSRSGAVNGGRSDQTNVTLDGVDDNDQIRGLAFFGVLRETQDSIEEFRVTTGNANADSGRSSGAQVSLVTKSGTNKYHGAAYEYFRPSNTVSNDFFNKQGQLSSGLSNRPPKLIRNLYGGDVGGFIVKDKLFFFGNYEALRKAESAVVELPTPTASYKAGTLKYYGTTATGGTELQTLSPSQVAQVDAGCTVCNTTSYTPGPGPNPYVLAYLAMLPTANGTSDGDGGLNIGSYTFASPNPQRLNTSIVRLDYDPSSKHRIFARGNFQKDTTGGVQQFPGQPPSFTLVDNTKGFTLGHTFTITQNIVNDLRFGYIRQGYGQAGVGKGDYVDFRFLASPTAETRNTTISVPVSNIIDNFSWSKGKHNIQVGGNWRLIHQNRSSNANSFNSASSNPYYLGGSPPDPSTTPGLAGFDPVDPSFSNSYLVALGNLLGSIPEVNDVSNYTVTGPTSGSLLADGAPVERHFKANEYEYYLQDSWRARPNLTFTFGVRHTILQTPWETRGQQVAPTIDTDAFFKQRAAAAAAGTIYEPDLTFNPSGPYYQTQGFYPKNKHDFAPRFAVAYSPDAKTSIRAGFGLYYDHFGQGLINTFDQHGEFGLSTQVTTPPATFDTTSAPRFNSRSTLPFSNITFPTTQAFPYTAPLDNFSISWGIDNKIKTPYTEAFDLSIQRELPFGFTLEASYVGRRGKHLLQNLDLAEPVNFVDNQGGGDYYAAGTALSKIVDQNGGYKSSLNTSNGGSGFGGPHTNQYATVAPIPYFEHLFPYMAGFDYAGESATQAIYTNEWSPSRSVLGATTALADLDFYCYAEFVNRNIPCPAGSSSRFWQDQFASLYSLASVGKSYYNAAQFTLHHPMSHGLQADVSYTFAKSIDWGSDAERSNLFGTGSAPGNSQISNSFKPYLNRAVSDFDTKQAVTLNYLYALPFGKGKAFLGNSGFLVNSLVGGWQLSGIFRVTSGLPFSLFEPGYTTNWEIPSYAVVTGKVTTQKHFDANGNIQFFNNVGAINSGVNNGSPIRFPYPGEAGQRNNFRGDGYIGLDSGLNKSWKLAEYGAVRFGWEVYNVTNTNRFDPFSIGSQLTASNLGVASTLLTVPRRMQFSLRYDF